MVAINWLGPKGSKGKPISGTWNTTTNWDAGKVPGRSDDVNLGGKSNKSIVKMDARSVGNPVIRKL